MAAPIDLTRREGWQQLLDRANADAVFMRKVAPLESICVEVCVDQHFFYLEFHRGQVTLLPARPIRGGALQIEGSHTAWQVLASGKLPYVHAIHFEHGVLKFRGDGLVSGWATPALSELFRIAAGRVAAPVESPQEERNAPTITGHYVTVDGIRAYYETCGSGEPILLLHTAGRDNRQWHGVMERLGDTYQLIAPDLPGHGKSAPRTDNTCFMDARQIADWLLAFMRTVVGKPFFLMGTSIGGNLSLLLPAISRDVRAAMAMQAADYSTFPEAGLQMLVHPQNNPMHSAMDFAMSLVGPAADAAGRRAIEWSVLTINARAQHDDLTAYARFDIRAQMGDIRCPMLLVHGDADWVVTRAMIDSALSRLTNAASARLVSLGGLGHYPHVEDPARIAMLARELFV